MPVLLTDLLAAPGLHLVVAGGSASALRREIRWCAVTELLDPKPWLQGDELVLTTGLRHRGVAAQRLFVENLVAAGAAGIGYGLGLGHEHIPRAVLVAAAEADLPVLEVPYETPFLAISRLVADGVIADHYQQVREIVAAKDLLASALIGGGGLGDVTETLHRVSGVPVAVTDPMGFVLAGSELPTAGARHPIVIAGERVATLHIGDGPARPELVPFAVSLLGIELARSRSVLEGQRGLLGQVLDDLARDVLAPAEARRRLVAHGIQPGCAYRVMVGRTDGPVPPMLLDLGGPAARVLDLVAVVLPAEAAARPAAMRLHAALGGEQARVGIGRSRDGVDGLRWSWFEAVEALGRGPGVHDAEPLSLPGLLDAARVPLDQVGRELLAPLLEFDAAHDGSLLATLRAFLELDGQMLQIAERLFVHRNTVRYRLAQIEQLIGVSLTSTSDVVRLWLAVRAIGGAAADLL
jgi:purine catabolism regulator